MAWNLLFTSDIGLLSLFTILFIVVMAIYIGRYVVREMKKEDQDKAAGPRQGAH